MGWRYPNHQFMDRSRPLPFILALIILLIARQYPIQFDFYEHSGGAVAELYWTSPLLPDGGGDAPIDLKYLYPPDSLLPTAVSTSTPTPTNTPTKYQYSHHVPILPREPIPPALLTPYQYPYAYQYSHTHLYPHTHQHPLAHQYSHNYQHLHQYSHENEYSLTHHILPTHYLYSYAHQHTPTITNTFTPTNTRTNTPTNTATSTPTNTSTSTPTRHSYKHFHSNCLLPHELTLRQLLPRRPGRCRQLPPHRLQS